MINRHSGNQQAIRGQLSEVRLPFPDLQLITIRECSRRRSEIRREGTRRLKVPEKRYVIVEKVLTLVL